MSLLAPPPTAFDSADEPLTLPPEPPRPSRPPVPIAAAFVPILGAVVLWLVTGSMLSLWLAFLGPLVAGATLLDGVRTARRDRRRSAAEMDAARDRIAASIDVRHERERERRRDRHPDVAAYLARESEIWRAVSGRAEGLRLGLGDAASALQVSGGGGDEPSAALRRRARVLADAPAVVPLSGGIAVVAPPLLAHAVSRALVLQACLASPPGEVRLVGRIPAGDEWLERLPHRSAASGTALALVAPGDPIPPDADVAIVRADPGVSPPPGCGATLTVSAPGRAVLDVGGDVRAVSIEGVSLAQAEAIADDLAARAGSLPGAETGLRAPVMLAELLPGAPSHGLAAVVGLDGGAPAVIDLVADGPHAVVAGITGSGKSELLVTWVLALCATRSPREVSFLLADFKGGTAFEPLAALPHVTGVITDLDGAGSRRAIESLRAEVRWREAALARLGARDILDERVELPRLVVVVDEFAALLGDHPELNAVFTDIAARGRALGMHLVLGTQRVAGVVRDALLANCPLRISLRVADPADSRAVIGGDEAARLPGGDAGRGVAFVRRAGEGAAHRVRVALSEVSDLVAIQAGAEAHHPRRPWLPDLPLRVDLAELHPDDPAEAHGRLVLGLADEPDKQRQVPVTVGLADRGVLVVGAAGTGKSTALTTIAGQAAASIVIPTDLEDAWDAVAALAEEPPQPGSVIVIDDLDALAARFPHDYSAEFTDRLERVVRGAGDHGVFVAAAVQRVAGASGRIAELLPRRVLLGASSRSEYIAHGGAPADHSERQPPGRARIEGRAVQIAIGPPPLRAERGPMTDWSPGAGVTGFVARRSSSTRAIVGAWQKRGMRVIPVADAAAQRPEAGTLVVGDAEDWQRHWQLLTAVRDEHELVIHTSVAGDFRALSADRALPPFCLPGRPRAWLCRDGLAAQRIALPSPAAGV